MTRWCHSAAQLRDVVTKDSDAASALWELFVRRGFRWKNGYTLPSLNPRETVQNVDSTLWTNLMTTSLQTIFHQVRRVSRCLREMRAEPIFRNFPSCPLVLDLGFLHQKPLILYIEMRLCWFPASEATDPEHCDDFLSVPCFLMTQNSLLTSWRFSKKLKIHGLLSDACTLDTCSVTDDLLRRSLAS